MIEFNTENNHEIFQYVFLLFKIVFINFYVLLMVMVSVKREEFQGNVFQDKGFQRDVFHGEVFYDLH